MTKRFGEATAVHDLSFVAEPGETLGFLGPNGAGKTTTLRMVLDILQPSAGTINVLGRRPGPAARAAIGFLPEERGLYRDDTALAAIIYFGRLKGMSSRAARRSAEALIERFALAQIATTRIDALSRGMVQKVQLATALVNAPELLLLDEPFSGLDPVNQKLLEEVIRERARDGASIVFSTHIMEHAERLCDRLLLIARGRKLFAGTPREARAVLPGRLSLTARGDVASLPGLRRATPLNAGDGWTDWEIVLEPEAAPSDVLEACFDHSVRLRRFEEHRPSLYEVFVHLVGANGGEEQM